MNTHLYGGGDKFDVAAAYAFHIAESQAFNDGNKRTGTSAAITFLHLNGVRILEDDGTLYSALIDVAEKKQTKSDLANVLRKLAVPID